MDDKRIKVFEADFRAICERHDMNAAFVLVRETKGGMVNLMVGGRAELSDFVGSCIRPNTIETERVAKQVN